MNPPGTAMMPRGLRMSGFCRKSSKPEPSRFMRQMRPGSESVVTNGSVT